MSKSDDPNPAMTRPREGDLSAVTLWPEVEKVFGHGYEVSYCVKRTVFHS